MIELVMAEAAQAVAPDRWTIKTTPSPEPNLRGWTVSLESLSGRGAGISVHLTDPPTTFDVKLGECGLIEFTATDEDDSGTCAEIRELVELVLTGRYSEWLWYAQDQIVRCKGLLRRMNDIKVITYRDLIPSLTRKTRREYREYKPY